MKKAVWKNPFAKKNKGPWKDHFGNTLGSLDLGSRIAVLDGDRIDLYCLCELSLLRHAGLDMLLSCICEN